MKVGGSPAPKIGEGSSFGSVERIMANAGAVELPLLTRTNYHEWSLVMQVSMEALEQWDAVEAATKDRAKDRRALATIIRAVPGEMKAGLAVKKSAKEAWEAVKSMHAGDDRMKTASIQRLLRQFEGLAFRDGERAGDVAMRVNGLVASLRELGEQLPDSRVVKKMLRVVPRRLRQVAVSIEIHEDLNTMTIEELVGRLQIAEDADADDQEVSNPANSGQLLLTEAQWEARRRQRGKEVRSGGARRGGGEHGDGYNDDRGDDDGSSSTSLGRGRSRYRGRCFDCKVRGHMARDCPLKKKERALLTDIDEEPALL